MNRLSTDPPDDQPTIHEGGGWLSGPCIDPPGYRRAQQERRDWQLVQGLVFAITGELPEAPGVDE